MKHVDLKIQDLRKNSTDKLKGRDVYFLWSGGEDSTALLKMLIEFDIQTLCNMTIVTIPFPQHVYYYEHLSKAQEYLEKLGFNVAILYAKRHDFALPYSEACGVCKIMRRTMFMDYYSSQKKNNDIIITAHNLYDLMSYYTEMAITNMSVEEIPQQKERKLEVTNKLLESYITEVGTELFRPMIYFTQPEIQQILGCRKFDNGKLSIVENECLWANQRKRLLHDYFQKAKIISDFTTVYKLFSDSFGIPSNCDFQALPYETYLV